MSVEDSIRMAGIDPLDVGDNRIRNIRVGLEKKRERGYTIQMDMPKGQDRYKAVRMDGQEPEKPVSVQEEGWLLLETNPYVESVDHAGVQMKNAFYNEAYLLYPLGLEQIFSIFELPSQWIPERCI